MEHTQSIRPIAGNKSSHYYEGPWDKILRLAKYLRDVKEVSQLIAFQRDRKDPKIAGLIIRLKSASIERKAMKI